jgi:hypothetical protein
MDVDQSFFSSCLASYMLAPDGSPAVKLETEVHVLVFVHAGSGEIAGYLLCIVCKALVHCLDSHRGINSAHTQTQSLETVDAGRDQDEQRTAEGDQTSQKWRLESYQQLCIRKN